MRQTQHQSLNAGSRFQRIRSLFLFVITLTNGFTKRLEKLFDPGRQRLYGLLIHLRLLEGQ